MTSMRTRAIDVAAAAFREAGVRAPRTQASTAVDALLAAGLLHDPTPAPDCERFDRAGGYCIEGDLCSCSVPPRDAEPA